MTKFLNRFSAHQKNQITLILASLILLTMFAVAFFSSRGGFGIPGDSGTTDEVAHTPSGYSYVKYLDFRLNPEHPPLAKALAGVPLALQEDIKGPKDDWSWNGINQWEAGWYMIYEAGNDPARVLFWARLPMMLLMIGLGLFLFKWARELYGKKIGLIVLTLFAFYPDILGHGRLVTTDIAAAFGFLTSTYYFDKALQSPTWKKTLVAGLIFGLAQLLKFSSFLLLGVFLILIVIKAILERKKVGFWVGFWRYFKIYFFVSLISLLLVWLIYIPFVLKTPVGIEHQLIDNNLTLDARTEILRRFLHYLEGNVITRALGHYLLGIMLVFARVAGGNNTFALGHVSSKSIAWFFPFAWLVKTPITIIVLSFTSTILLFFRRKETKKNIWLLSVILMPWLVYWILTLKGSLNIGIRHLMPTVPFVLLFIGYGLKQIFASSKRWTVYAVSALVVYMAISTLSNYPSFLAYFNEAVPRDQRYNYLVDSSLDWGQDLLRLKKYVEDNNIKDLKIDYFGGSMPSYYLPQAKPWHSSYGPTTGWLAVSATFYQSSKLTGPKEGTWSYAWLDEIRPVKIIGGSILVFHLTQDDLIKHPPKMNYEIKKIDLPETK